jgi:beta-galactosidase
MPENSHKRVDLIPFSPTSKMESKPLNQPWEFRQDPDNIGLIEEWYKPTFDFDANSSPITVPSSWEETYEDYEGVGWYATSFHTGPDKAGQACRLVFEAANYRTTVWVNGHEAGTNEGGYTPFAFQIEDYLNHDAENTVVVRIVSPIITRDIQVDGLGPNDMPHWRGGLTAGIWQPVHLKFNEKAWIADTFYKPDLANGAFHLDLTMESMVEAKADAVISLVDAEGNPAGAVSVAIQLVQGTNFIGQTIKLKDPVPWSCEDPHLYTATATLLIDGQPVDRSVARIGLREFTYKQERFYLNGKRIYLRGGFWEGVYARHQSYPADREIIRKEIELAKAAGFNLLRPWRRPVPPLILDEADAAGLLVIASPAVECMSCWPNITPQMPQRVEHEIRDLILRDRNHPSIIWWEMFNEVTREEVAALITPMSRMARGLDPTRLVLDESGGWASGAHFYLPGSTDKKDLCEVHSYVRAPVSDFFWNRYRTLGTEETIEGHTEIKRGAGIFMSEFGFGGLPEIEENCRLFSKHGNPKLPAYRQHHKLLQDLKSALKACQLEGIYPDVDSFCRASQSIQARGNQRQMEALLANPNVSGYCLHAFTDGDWILGAGIIDHWQRPKAVYQAIQESNEVPRLLAFPETRNLRPGDPVSCLLVLRGENAPLPEQLKLVNGSREIIVADLQWSSGTNCRETCIELSADLFEPGWNHIRVQSADHRGDPVPCSKVDIFVVGPTTRRPEHGLVVYDPEREVTPWLEANNYEWLPLLEWVPDGQPATFLIVPDDVAEQEDLPQVAAALDHVEKGIGTALFLQPPAAHESVWMLSQYDAGTVTPLKENRLFQSGTFPFSVTCRPSFAFWESAMHMARKHPVFEGLPSDCPMDEPYHEVAPVESFYQLEFVEAPSQTITWFRPEDISTKAKKRTYLGGEDIWYGTNLASVRHGEGMCILSTLILRRKIRRDPVAERIFGNLLNHADSLLKANPRVTLHEHSS